MDWSELHFGIIRKKDIKRCVSRQDWQEVRHRMKGTNLEYKYKTCKEWLERNDYSDESKIQVTNYVNALSRGGLVSRNDYIK